MSTRDSSTNPDEGEDKVVSKERDGTRDKDAEKGERGDRGGHRQRSSTNAASKSVYSAVHETASFFFSSLTIILCSKGLIACSM